MKRVKALPEDYQYVFKKSKHIFGNSQQVPDMMKVQCCLIDLFEEGAANSKCILEITGDDVAAFVDELLNNTRTYT